MKNRDSIRLDWLQKHKALVNEPSTLSGRAHICLHIGLEEPRHFYAKTYRRVIDLAMKETSR